MPKIVIREFDETTPGNGQGLVDIAFVPGLVDTEQASLWDKDGKYRGIEKGVPTLFTSYSDFTSVCGTKPVVFDRTYRYSELSGGFSLDAVPYTNIMFNEGDADPGYVMAKELLAAGLPVLFQRLNADPVKVAITTQPDTWDSSKYYKLSEVYQAVSGKSAPEFDNGTYYQATYVADKYVMLEEAPEDWGTDYSEYYIDNSGTYVSVEGVVNGEITEAPAFQANTYYEKITVNGNEYTRLTSAPSNWSTNWFDYYEQDGSIVRAAAGEDFVSNKFFTLDTGCDIESIYTSLDLVYSPAEDSEEALTDKGKYSFKYLTSGGYPVFEFDNNSIAIKMLKLAATRGDCVALIDHTDNIYRHTENPTNLFENVCESDFNSEHGEFGAMFTPWATYVRTTTDKEYVENQYIPTSISKTIRMPGSYAYLRCLADSIKTNASWLAVAGASRGVVPSLADKGMTTNITNGLADKMQPNGKDEGNNASVAINAITDIKPYGYTIWGNRTLKPINDGCTATSFLNIRNLISDVKKICYSTARALTFEQNNDVLWVNFKSKISPTLERMLSGAGISGYKFVRDRKREEELGKATLCAQIILFPTYAVEEFYIDIVLRDDDVTVE